tara:strand:- start:305 stop:748 length:444 start_codon:yes stop_codon:yes gene_type:complete
MLAVFESGDQTHPLNNGYPCTFKCGDKVFNSVEQYMMWKKASIFHGNETIASAIMMSDDYTTIKALGRKVQNFDPEVWSSMAESIVQCACILKIYQNKDVMAALISTNDEVIEQKNINDPTWSSPGKNLLGVILMRARQQLWAASLI